MRIGTNNGAESVHSQFNLKVNGNVSLFRFLTAIEDQMERSRKRIFWGCESESNPVITERNRLLASELHKLMNGNEGILSFLDNCASIVGMHTKRETNRFVPVRILPTEDIVLDDGSEAFVRAVAHRLYRRLCPGGQVDGDGQILRTVLAWSFPVLEPAVFDDVDGEQLSLVHSGPRKSLVDLLARAEQMFRESGQRVQTTRREMGVQTIIFPVQNAMQIEFKEIPTARQTNQMIPVSPRTRNHSTVQVGQVPQLRNRHDFDPE